MKKFLTLFVFGVLASFAANAQYTETKNITPLGFSGYFQYVAYGKDNGIIAVGNKNLLYTSKDTCKSWTIQKAPIDSIRGLIMAEDQTTGFIYNLYQIYKTVDGGKTWSEHKTNGIPQVIDKRRVEYRNFFIKNIDTLFFIITNRVNGMRIYMSVDNGDNWTEVAKDMDGNSYFSGIANMCFVTSNHGFAFGTAGFYAETQDGGLTWEKHVISHLTYFYDGVKCSDGTMIQVHDGSVPDIEGVKWVNLIESDKICSVADKIIILDSDGLRTTQDMGSSWIQTELSTTCNDMVFLSEKIGVLVGMNLTSYVTLDGGETWTKYVHGGGERFSGGIRDIYVKNENECFITGNTGRLFHISDDGDSWSWNDVHNQTIHELTFLTRDIGYLVGKNILLKTLDGGNTWLGQSIKISNAMYLDFPSIDTGFVGYSDLIPSIHKTENGGKNLYSLYTKEYRINKTNRAPFAFLTTQKGLVCADNNKILYTPDGCETWEVKSISDNENMEERDIVAVGTQGWLISVIEDRKIKIYYVDTTFSISIIHEFDESEGKGFILRKVSDTLFCIGMFQNEKRNLYFGNLTEWRKTDIPFYTTFYAYNEHVIYTYDANMTSVYKVIVYDDSLQVSLQKESNYKYTLFSNVQNVPLNLFLTNGTGEVVWSGQLNSGNGESTIDFPETIENGSYLLHIESGKGYYYKKTEPIEVILKADDTPVMEVSQEKGYTLSGRTLYVYSPLAKLYTILGTEIPLDNGTVELKTGIYMLVNGNENKKIIIK